MKKVYLVYTNDLCEYDIETRKVFSSFEKAKEFATNIAYKLSGKKYDKAYIQKSFTSIPKHYKGVSFVYNFGYGIEDDEFVAIEMLDFVEN